MRLLLASLICATAAAPLPVNAQEPSSKVMLPWQKAQAKPKPPSVAPTKPDALPWQSQTVDVLPWHDPSDATLSKAVGKAGAVETGTIAARPADAEGDGATSAGRAVGNGLVLKPNVAPPPGTMAAAAPGDAAGRQAATPVAVQLPIAAAVPPKPTAVAAPNAVVAQAVPAAAAQQAPPATSEAADKADATPANEAAAAEEAPPMPAALPEATVTPVAAPAALPVLRTPSAATDKPPLPKRLSDGANVAQQYCFNIADAAKDARYAWQKKTLADIELELNKRIALLDERTAEYQKWLARREDFIRQAEDGVVKIYGGMKPDAAAGRLSLMNEETAAALLTKLGPRSASAILNEMDATKAAKLTMIITGAAKLKRKQAAASDPVTPGSAGPATASERTPADAAANGPRS
jgi:flagellar motility protein MotE (MotC chaperone)